jgi:hypothetical protein
MAKFINKKEQVFDFQLTTYGREMLSIGSFKPTYYAFFDDNVIYDDRYIGIGKSATATITFGAVPAADQVITIVSTDGTSIAYTAKASTDTSANEFSRAGTNKLTASALKSCIEASGGHNGKIIVSIDGAVLKLTQLDEGANGNNEITENLDNTTVVGFAGGVSDGPRLAEPQNNIHNRIKNETQYLESFTLFQGLEKTVTDDTGHNVDFSNLQNYPSKYKLKKDAFKFDSAIGDAYLDGGANIAPAWKVVALQSRITSSATTSSMGQNIPQISFIANYNKEVHPARFDFEPPNVREINLETAAFIDRSTIAIKQNDPVIYAEEVNTENLTENFDIEVFEIIKDSNENVTLERKFFEKTVPQIVDGIMVSPTEIRNPDQYLTTGSVEYYFDIHTDQNVNQELACKGAEIFNKQSYYIELDFDCAAIQEGQSVYYDIYGTVTEPEICQT